MHHQFKERKIRPPEPPSQSLPFGELTLGELNGELLTVKSNNDPTIAYFLTKGVIYPNVLVREVPLISKTYTSTILKKSKCCSSIRQFWKRYFSQSPTNGHIFRYGHLIIESHKNSTATYSTQNEKEQQQKFQEEESSFFLRSFISRLFDFFFVMFGKIPNETELFKAIPSTLRIDPYAPFSSLAWHKYQQKFAVALRDDSIHIFDFNLIPPGVSPLSLWHEFQKDICCMEWKPFSGTVLAVGCRYGVCLWTIVKKKLQTKNPREGPVIVYRDHSAWLDYLQYNGHAPVNTLAWSPNGEYLATGSVNMSQVLIWDVALKQATLLAEYTPFSGITLLKWSPDSRYLFAATTKAVFRVWETTRWSSEKWTNFGGYCQSAAWSSDSSHLAIAISGDSKIYFLQFPKSFGGYVVATEDVSPYEIKIGQNKFYVGGTIREIAWDPSGERLAVSFLSTTTSHFEIPSVSRLNEETEDPIITDEVLSSSKEEESLSNIIARSNDQLIAVFVTKSKPVLKLDALGFIRGPASGKWPICLSFRPNFPRGALLTVGWRSGKISFYPLYFETTNS